MQKRRKNRRFSREFKIQTVERILKGENISALSRELKVLRKDLYVWRDAYQRGGEELLRSVGRPRKAAIEISGTELEKAQRRIAELERKVGQQELELDFFAKALKCIDETQRVEKAGDRSTSLSNSRRLKAN
jgi:transposase-like protein